jgi:hypothetical protein
MVKNVFKVLLFHILAKVFLIPTMDVDKTRTHPSTVYTVEFDIEKNMVKVPVYNSK